MGCVSGPKTVFPSTPLFLIHQIKESDRIISVCDLSFYEAARSSVITIYMFNSLILHWDKWAK